MKILAIRGKNLASLAGKFELDFQSEPLASAGLYAITGATGSGKSTLLDALCLALYEQTPRLSGIAGSAAITDVGSNAITAGDVRGILRRGCGDGYAEVDFVGSDGIAYRTRWQVRRAHGKAIGKLQQSEISLVRIRDGQTLGDTRKTETLKLIQNLIGLSFEQFTRAVLLAQNDFTAFLKATDDARAELLQTLTGTESYAKISTLAFERMKAEKEKLAQLQAQWQALAPLTAELKTEKQAQLQAQLDQLAALAQQKSGIEGHLRWYQLGAQLNDAQANARQILTTAQAAKNAAAPRAVQLTQLEHVQSARPLRSDVSRVAQAEGDAAYAHDFAQKAFLQAHAELDERAGKQTLAHQQSDIAEANKIQAQPDLDAAKAGDASIGTITPLVAAAMREYQSAADQLQLELGLQADALAAMQVDQAKLAAAQQWLIRNDALRPLAQSWQRWETLFDEAHKILTSQANAAALIAELNVELDALNLAFNRVSETQALAEQTLKIAQAQLSQLSTDCAALDSEQLAARRVALELRQTQCQTGLSWCEKLIEIKGLQQQHRQQLQQYQGDLSKNADNLRVNLQHLPLLQCAVQIAQESLQLASLAASKDAESMRAALLSDRPCPVCGALAHPYAEQPYAKQPYAEQPYAKQPYAEQPYAEHPYAEHSPAAPVLKSLRDQLNAKQKALRDVELAIAATHANSANAEQAITQLAPRLDQLDTEHAALNALWAQHALHEPIEALLESARVQTLTAQENAVQRELAQLRDEEVLYRDTLRRKDAAQVQVNLDHLALTKANQLFANLASARAAANQTLNASERDLLKLTEQLAARQNQIDSAFDAPSWRAQWRQNPSAFLQGRRADVDHWTRQHAEVTTLDMRLAKLQMTISACEKSCLQASDLRDSRREKHAELALALQSYRQHRDELFGGRPIAQVQVTLDAAVLLAKTEIAASDELLKRAQAEFTRAQQALGHTETRLEQERRALQIARSALDTWLAEFVLENDVAAAAQAPNSDMQRLTLPALDSLLQITPEWIGNERSALHDLMRAVHTAQAVLDARSQSRSAHEAAQTEFAPRDVLQESLAQLQLQFSAQTEALSSLKLELALDDERVRQAAALRGKIEEQMNDSRVWAQLGELIGSADGKKFRNFAQQLTLDILLSYANQHLQTLTRRYRVQRIKDSLGLLVVDQEMGDEVRSVHSLSGGESFLLSLALALGLASLSSHRVRVESLFIDEGFGSLDAESLGVAMDALDNLQSQGRKIGVISHLQELTERIGVRVQLQRQAGGLSKLTLFA